MVPAIISSKYETNKPFQIVRLPQISTCSSSYPPRHSLFSDHPTKILTIASHPPHTLREESIRNYLTTPSTWQKSSHCAGAFLFPPHPTRIDFLLHARRQASLLKPPSVQRKTRGDPADNFLIPTFFKRDFWDYAQIFFVGLANMLGYSFGLSRTKVHGESSNYCNSAADLVKS
jgi:hypothetical protein